MPDTFRTFKDKVASSKKKFFWMVNRENSKKYTEMMNCLNEINEVGKGKPITADKIDRLVGLHERLGTIAQQYTQTRKHAVTVDGRERLGMAKRILDLQKEENISIFRDKKAVDEANRAGKSVGDLLNETRLPRVDITGRRKETVGAALSSREKVEYKGQPGYFTYGKQIVRTAAQLDADLKKPMSSKGREIIEANQEFFSDGFNMDDLDGAVKNMLKADNKNLEKYNAAFEDFVSKLPSRSANLLRQNPKNVTEVAEYCKGAKKHQDMLDVAKRTGIKEGDELSRRNIATSRMAGLLGVDSLVAKSERMVLKDGKIQREGVFMANAVGLDVNDPDKRHLVFGEELDCSTPEFQRQITSLQILDTLCGQVDRHTGNIFYDVHDGKITGIQGIDNDMAFGTNSDVMSQHRELPSIRTIKAADKTLVERIAGLKREEFDRTFADVLTVDEIEAAWKRTQAVATHLSGPDVEKKASSTDWNAASYGKIGKDGYANAVKWGLDKIQAEKADLIMENAVKMGVHLPPRGVADTVPGPVRREVTIEEIQQMPKHAATQIPPEPVMQQVVTEEIAMPQHTSTQYGPEKQYVVVEEIHDTPQHAAIYSNPVKQQATVEKVPQPQHAKVVPGSNQTAARTPVSVDNLQGKAPEKKTPTVPVSKRPLPTTPAVRGKK